MKPLASRTPRRRRARPDTVAAPPPPSGIALALVEPQEAAALAVRSAFDPGQPIPLAHAADGDDASPPVAWEAPEGTRSIVLVMDDPDAAEPKPFVHWLAYDIPASVSALREGLPPEPLLVEPAMKQGRNSRGATGYTGPKPPAGDPPHHYHLQVFALSVDSLGLDPGATREEVLEALAGKVLAAGEIVGTFER